MGSDYLYALHLASLLLVSVFSMLVRDGLNPAQLLLSVLSQAGVEGLQDS